MTGTYKIYYRGETIVVPNIITDAGERRVLEHLAGKLNVFAEAIGIGVMNNTPIKADTQLGFQVDKFPITVASPDYASNKVIYKAQIPAQLSFDIYELGLWGIDANLDNVSKMLFTFETDVETWSTGTYSASNSRVGEVALTFPVTTTATTTISNLNLNLNQLAGLDEFAVAAYSTGTCNLILRFHTAELDYFQVSGSKSPGYTVTRIPKTPSVTGSPDWANIISVDVIVESLSDTIYLDGIQMNSSGLLNKPVLISRALLDTPVSKLTTEQMDIEYEFGISV